MSNSDSDISLAEQEQDLPREIKEKKSTGRLRNGYTTGTCAAAATKAALHALLHWKTVESIDVTLPKEKKATLKIKWTDTARMAERIASSAVIKDGGDDPDVTSGAEICSIVELTNSGGKILIDGGQGVGRVTKPGLGLEIGTAAINPTPRWMIEQAVSEEISSYQNVGVKVTIYVPTGETLALKTDNPRLGILGGISILGTTGIVLPYSTASFAASIRQSIDVAKAMGADTVVLTTGGRSEDFARALFGSLPDHSFIQIGDFAGYSIKQCASREMKNVIIAGFIGKLTKMAMGIKQTHVAGSHVNMQFMADLASECGASQSVAEAIRSANTARHVSEILRENSVPGYFDLICKKVFEKMNEYTGGILRIKVCLFEFDGELIGSYSC